MRVASATCVLLQSSQFRVVLVHERLNEFRLHQLVFQPTQHTVLYVFGRHGSVVGAGALLARVRTPVSFPVCHRQIAATHPTFNQATEDPFRPAVLMKLGMGLGCQPCLHGIPDLHIDDGQLRHFGLDPFGLVLRACLAVSCIGITHEGMTIEDLSA